VNISSDRFGSFEFWALGIVSDFGFRGSNLRLLFYHRAIELRAYPKDRISHIQMKHIGTIKYPTLPS
jgi:hypothetical protein